MRSPSIRWEFMNRAYSYSLLIQPCAGRLANQIQMRLHTGITLAGPQVSTAPCWCMTTDLNNVIYDNTWGKYAGSVSTTRVGGGYMASTACPFFRSYLAKRTPGRRPLGCVPVDQDGNFMNRAYSYSHIDPAVCRQACESDPNAFAYGHNPGWLVHTAPAGV